MFLANENAISSGNYLISNSLRFQSASSTYATRTPASASNQQKYTWSGWIKLGAITSTEDIFFGCGDTYFHVSSGKIGGNFRNGATNYFIDSTMVLRDPSAWYHVVYSVDTTQATAANRIIIYINNVQVTSFSTSNYPPQNFSTAINSTALHALGRYSTGGNYWDGYMAEVNFIDGQALTPSSFGETNTLTGQWVAKKYTGTYGTNGFYLPFSNGTSTTTLGADSSGNGNNWTLTNFTRSAGVSDCWMYDVPSGNGGASGTQPNSNYAVLNPLGGFLTPLRANLQISQGTSAWNSTGSTIYPTTGKWYVEASPSNLTGAQYIGVGLRPAGQIGSGEYAGSVSGSYGGILSSININAYNGGVLGSSLSGTFTTSTPICMAVDFDAGKVWFGSNNSWVGGGNPATGTSPTYTFTANTQFNIYFCAYANDCYPNFGQRSFAYTPPSGFKALCTANLPASTIVKGNQYMDATLYTGNATARSITNAAGFSPEFVWIKERSSTSSHQLFDVVRGATKNLESNTTSAEGTFAQTLTSFNADGFSLGTDSAVNENTQTYVAWQWDAGSSTVTNTSGTISSQVRANPTAGVSVVTWTSNSSSATIGHGLGVSPAMIIAKSRSLAGGTWPCYHKDLGKDKYIQLNATTAATTYSNYWGTVTPNSTVFGAAGNFDNNTGTMVAYCFAEIAGFSKFGSYTGNGSADGVFVYTGFRPKFVMIKRTDTTGNWAIHDTSRSPFNQIGDYLLANAADAEVGGSILAIDALSNGFKLRVTQANENASGGTYIYMAFAESPFANSNSR